MKVKFQYTKDEYARAYWMNSRRLRNPKLDAIMITLLLPLGVWSLVNSEVLWIGLLPLGSTGLLLCLFMAVRYIIPYFTYNRYILNRGEYTLDFMEDSIHFKAKNIDSNLSWAMYTHALSGPEHYLLYYGKNQYTIVPRRIFASPDQLNAFDGLLKQKIANIEVI